ncbi:MAG: T9SS type A sorting domain-containing protein [bacterium]|nr:T9SS type A sorting domain-containing protein [bacterium]
MRTVAKLCFYTTTMLFLTVCCSFAQSQAGSVVIWGSNTYGQLNVPHPNRDFISISTSGAHVIGLKSDNTIVAWGENSWGRATAPADNADFVAISAGHCHNLALKSDGSIVAWGYNAYGQCNVPDPNSDFIAVAGGGYHSLALKSDGSIVAFGQNYSGCNDVPNPNSGFEKISAGWAHSVGKKLDGTIVVWGDNTYGENNIPDPNNYISMAGGGGHYLALRNDGSIEAWGNNDCLQSIVPSPNQNFVALDAEGRGSIALKHDGTVIYWGCYEAHPDMPTGVPAEANGAFLVTTGLECSAVLVPFQGGTVEANYTPSTIDLKPAYPNPFNPSTSIDFTLEQTDKVKLIIHNINGQQVAVLQDGLMERGSHTVDFTASGLASGVYTYTLEVGSFKQTKSFTLVK